VVGATKLEALISKHRHDGVMNASVVVSVEVTKWYYWRRPAEL